MIRLRSSMLVAVTLLIMACGQGGGASPSPTKASGSPPTSSGPASSGPAAATPAASTAAAGDPNDLLAKIRAAGVMKVSTDPNYKPQSFLKPDGTFEGFDIDTANEIGKRLGVKVQFEPPNFDLVVAGGWQARWDVSVGSVTVTDDRLKVLDFTSAYYFTPAQLAASKKSGITTVDGFAGKTICVGSSTTYQYWIDGTLKLKDAPTPAAVPAGAKAAPLETDQLCAQAIQSRGEYDGWLSSITTVESAIKDGVPVAKVGDPVFYEPIAVAVDKAGPPHAGLSAELDRIVKEMHADGTLSASSKKWFDGVDFTSAR